MAQTISGATDMTETHKPTTGMKTVINDKKTTLVHDFTPGHEYEVIVRAVGPDGTNEAMEIAARNTITITGKTAVPSPPTALTATGIIHAIKLSWTNPADYDVHRIQVWRSYTDNVYMALKIAEVDGITYTDQIGTGNATRYYWIRAVNTSEGVSDYHPSTVEGVSATTLGITTTSIDDFAVTATKMFTKAIILTADAWTNNSPGAGSIAWNAHSVVYNGASYPITAGNTAAAYVYWVVGGTTYSTSATHPVLGTTGFMVAINTAGIHTMVWNSSANMVIGSAFIANLLVDKLVANAASTNEFVSNTAQIKNAIITNAKINDLSVGKLTSGAVTSKTITLSSSGAADCYINAGKSKWDNTQTGFILGLDSTIPKFYIGDATTYLNWTGAGLAVRGDITITGGSGIASLTDAGSLAVKDDVGASDCDVTIISGDKIITTLLTATNIQAGTLTGRTVQTAASGQRIILDQSDNTLKMYRAAEANPCVLLDDDGTLTGPILAMAGIVNPYAASIQLGKDTSQFAYFRHDYMAYKSAVSAVAMLDLWGLTGNVHLMSGKNNAGTITSFITPAGLVAAAVGFRVAGTIVVQSQGAAVIDATDAASAITQLNSLLARIRAHGLIA